MFSAIVMKNVFVCICVYVFLLGVGVRACVRALCYQFTRHTVYNLE